MLATFMVTNDADAPENTPAAVGTLRQAIADAENLAGTDTIEFASSLNGATINLTEGALNITQSVTIDGTIDGAGPSQELLGITIDASGNDPTPNSTFFDGDPNNDGDGSTILSITSGDVEINGLTLTGGDAYLAAGAINSRGFYADLIVKNSKIIDNNAYGGAGGITAVFNHNLTIENCTISGNVGTSGGGIRFDPGGEVVGGQLTMLSSTVSNNSSTNTDGTGSVFLFRATRFRQTFSRASSPAITLRSGVVESTSEART